MPEFESRRPVKKKSKKVKKQNIFISIISGLIPWKGDKKGDVIRKIVFLAAMALLIYASIVLVNFYVFRDIDTNADLARWTALKEQNSSDDVVTIHIEEEDVTNGNESGDVEVLSEYLPYYEQNNDFVGWIAIKPYINYPVAQTTDNDFYLKHNYDKVPTDNGTIFADYECTISADKMAGNTILYGHNLITNNYFQPLGHYKELDFLKDNPTITFDTLYNRGTYKIFSVVLCNTLEEHGDIFEYYKTINFANKSEFDNFAADCLDRSYYYTGVDLQYGDEILTLSTCDFQMFSDMRLVVFARKVRENESPLVDTEKFIDNSGMDESGKVKRKMFDAYYETYKTEWAGRKWDPEYIKDFKGE